MVTDHRFDSNSDVTVTKQVDSKTVSLGSNYVSNDPICTIKRWDKAAISYKDVSYPQIVLAYDKDRGACRSSRYTDIIIQNKGQNKAQVHRDTLVFSRYF